MADVTIHHGGDDGNEDNRGPPPSIQNGCKASQTKKTRGHGKNYNLYEEWEKNGKKPLPIRFQVSKKQYKAVGKNASMFVRLMSNEIDENLPLHYNGWRNVPYDDKVALQKTLHHFFDLKSHHNTPHWGGINEGINMDCAHRYSERKAKLKVHFDSVGGYQNLEKAKKNHAPWISKDRWLQVIEELFQTEQYKNRSQKNKANRAKQKYGSFHGSKSYAQRRDEREQATGKADHIGVWKDMHFKKNKWYNEHAKRDWGKIQQEMDKTLSTMGGDAEPIDEADILDRSLGSTHSHTRGVGRKVKNPTPNASSSSGYDSYLQEKLQEQQQINQQLQNQINQILGHIGVGSSSQYTQEDDEEDMYNEDNEHSEENEESND